MHEDPSLLVTWPRQSQMVGDEPEATVSFCDRIAAVVQSMEDCDQSRVDSRRSGGDRPSVAALPGPGEIFPNQI